MAQRAIPAGETRLIEPNNWPYFGREVVVVRTDTAGHYMVRGADGREHRIHRRQLIRATPEGRRFVEALATLRRLEDEITAEAQAVHTAAIAKRKGEMARASELARSLDRSVHDD